MLSAVDGFKKGPPPGEARAKKPWADAKNMPLDPNRLLHVERRRAEKEMEDAAMHDLTYSLHDWQAKEASVVPLQRSSLVKELAAQTPLQRGGGSRGGRGVPRPGGTASSRMSVPEEAVAVRASQVLSAVTPDAWADIARRGAPEAWQVAPKLKGSRKGNLLLRKELAHITLIRDQARRGGAQSVPLRPPADDVEARQNGIPGLQGVHSLQSAASPQTAAGQEQLPPPSRRAGVACPGASASRPATSMSGIRLVMTPTTMRQHQLKQMLGTESRPSTQYAIFKRRMPQAEKHFIWPGAEPGVKRFDEYEKKIQEELMAEKREQNSRRRLLLKQLRMKMQGAATDTRKLARELWDKFKIADDDGSGRLEFGEYCAVMEACGLGEDKLGMQGLKTLYRIADKDGNGNIDVRRVPECACCYAQYCVNNPMV